MSAEKKQSIYDTLGRDLDSEKKGVWLDLTEDIAVKITSLNSPSVKKAWEKLQRPHKMKVRKNTLADKIMLGLMARLMADHIIKDWKGFVLKGKDVECTKANVLEILSDSRMDETNALIFATAGDADFFKEEGYDYTDEELNEDTEKNLEKTSTGI